MCEFDLYYDLYYRCYNIVLMVTPQNTCPEEPALEETEGIQHHKKIIKKIEALKNPPL